MSDALKILVKNTPEELLSFPLNQSIKLVSSEVIEDSLVKDNIVLLRNIREFGLLNPADLYNFNIGYVKENFSYVPVNISIDNNDITVKPIQTLNPNSSYTLFLDKNLSIEHIEIIKTVSKSNAQLELLVDNTVKEITKEYIVKIVSDPFITERNNIVKLQVYVNGVALNTYNIDAKSTRNTFSIDGLTFKVLDTAYGKGEEFKLAYSEPSLKLNENLIVEIYTVLNKEIKPVDNENISSKISYEDVLEYYKLNDKSEPSVKNLKNISESNIEIEYVSCNQVLLHLTDGLTYEDLDLDNIEVREFPAYNRYDLKALELYDPEEKYEIKHSKIDDTTVLLEFEKVVI